MTSWTGPFLHAYDPSDLVNRKSVQDHGRTVDELNVFNTDSTFEGGAFGSGRATTSIADRDNYPLVEKGDIVKTFCRHPSFINGKDAVVAIFIVERIEIAENADGYGEVVYSGAGISKELQRKVLRIPYISATYSGTCVNWTDTYIFLDAAHVQADDFYNGGVVEIEGYAAEITDYNNADNRAYVTNWTPGDPDSGGQHAYKIYHGNAANDIQQAISPTQTEWASDTNGTPNGSFHTVGGRKCSDLINDIATQTAWQYASNITDDPLRMLFWFDTTGTPVASGVSLVKVGDVPIDTFANDINIGPILDCKRSLAIDSAFTRLLATGGDGLSFAGVDPLDLTIPAGFTLVEAESMVIYDTAEVGMSIHQISEQSETFQDITAQSDTPEALLDAQQRLLNACVDLLLARSYLNRDYTATTVMLRNASIGQSIRLTYERVLNSEVLWEVDNDLWVRSFSPSASHTDGVRYLTYNLGEYWQAGALDGNTALAERLKKMGGTSGGGVVITGGGGAPGVHTHEHADNLFLSADDHPIYLLTDGSRTLSGDMAVASGKTIDGVDISEHAATEDAHHSHGDGEGQLDFPFNIAEGRNIDFRTYTNLLTGHSNIYIDLSANVEIENVLRINRNAIFEMWDEEIQAYRGFTISSNGIQPFHIFNEPSDWSGNSLWVRYETRLNGALYETLPILINVDETLDFTDDSVVPEWGFIHHDSWVIYFNGQEFIRADNQSAFSYQFVLAGTYHVRRGMTIEDNSSGMQYTSGTSKDVIVS